MCDQTEISYSDGQVVWVKLGSYFWPGEVVGSDKIDPDVLNSFRKPPIAIVKFFQEDTYEYVRNHNAIYNYQCSKKFEFIKKGLDMYRAKNRLLEKFPDDVVKAESLTDGDEDILSREEFKEVKKESYAGLFGDPKSTGKRGRGVKTKQADIPVHSPIHKAKKRNSDYKVTILVQESKNTEDKTNLNAQASTSKDTSESPELCSGSPVKSAPSTPSTQELGAYKCHACPYSTSRLNVMIMHNKTHSASFTQYTPSPVRKKPVVKSPVKSPPKSSKVVKESKTPKVPKQRKEKPVKVNKRNAEDEATSSPVKKPKTDKEIKKCLLADWDDEWEDEEEKEAAESPEIPKPTSSPDIPVSADAVSVEVTDSAISNGKNSLEISPNEKLETTDSKYEFCEDEDWSLEADCGRKIPRVKNSCKLRNDIQAFNMDDEDMDKEVNELLEKTAVPELPSIPEVLKVEENFPDVPIVKSPDKEKTVQLVEKSSLKRLEEAPTKTIFKTKTFFRSRHSRSQDAIEKYVAEQLNSTEKMDSLDCDINGSDVATLSPETRDSPPIEPVKVARLAPKIQLKMMKAEAAQLKEKGILTSNYFDSHNYKEITLNEHQIPMLKSDANTEQKLAHINTVISSSSDVEKNNLSDDSARILENNNLNTESHLLHKKILDKDTYPGKSNDTETEYDILEETTKVVSSEDHFHQSQATMSDNMHYTNAATKVTTLPDILFEDEQPEVCSENRSQSKYGSEEDIREEILEAEIEDKRISTDLAAEKVSNPEVFALEQENVPGLVENVVKENVAEYKTDEEVTNDKEEINGEINAECVEMEQVLKETVTEYKTDEDVTNDKEEINGEINTESVEMSPVVKEIVTEYKTDEDVTNDKEEINGEINTESVEMSPVVKEIVTEYKTDEDVTNNKEEINGEINTESVEMSPVVKQNVAEYKTDEEVTNDKEEINGEINEETVEMEQVVNENDLSENVIAQNKVDEVAEDCLEQDKIYNEENHIKQNEVIAGHLTEDHETYVDQDNPLNEEVITKHIAEEESTYIEHAEAHDEDIVQEEVITEDIIEGDKTYMCEDVDVSEEVVTEDIADGNKGHACENTIDVTSQDYDIKTTNEHESINYLDEVPTESDIQMAEALMNLPSTHKQLPTIEATNTQITKHISVSQCESNKILTINDALNLSDENVHGNTFSDVAPLVRFETEEEKCQNLNAAQSLVEMSEQISEQIPEPIEEVTNIKLEVKNCSLLKKNICRANTIIESNNKLPERNSKPISKLLQILEEPRVVKKTSNFTQGKSLILPKTEKIINEGNTAAKTTRAHHPVTLIRRNVSNKRLLNKVVESPQEQLVLSRKRSSNDEPNVETYSIQETSNVKNDPNTIVIQQKGKTLKNTPPKILQKIKPNQTSLLGIKREPKLLNASNAYDDIFDINSMPVVLSDDIVTPENIDQMPIVMSDGNLLTNSPPPLLVRPKSIIKQVEKVPALAKITNKQTKPQMKTILLNPSPEVSRASTPNILTKSSKFKPGKPMLVIDKATGKQKIIIAKQETPSVTPVNSPTPYDSKAAKREKILILPTSNSSRTNRTQKILINPNSGQAHVLVASNTTEGPSLADSKPISAKLIPATNDSRSGTGRVMVITNAQGSQSKIVLTPAHEKLLFPKKQTPKPQFKTVTHRQIAVTTVQKQIISPLTQMTVASQTVVPKPQLKTIPNQKSTIITSKGQLIVGNRLTTSVSKSPITEIVTKCTQKRIIPDTSRLRRTPNEPLIFLQQKDGAVRQLTKEQFQYLQRSGQLVPNEPQVTTTVTAPTTSRDNKIIIQKSVTIKPPNEPSVSSIQRIQKSKQRVFKSSQESLILPKKVNQDVNLVPTVPPPFILQNPPALTAISAPHTNVKKQSLLIPDSRPQTSTNSFAELENYEELLPSTAIARQPDTILQVETNRPATETVDESNPNLQNILAMPGEHFGGPPGSFYLCVQNEGTISLVDNRPLVLKADQLVPMEDEQPVPEFTEQPERRDILEAALANSDVFHAEQTLDEPPDFRDLNANVSVHSCVSETSTTLNQPIMTPVEVPSKCESDPTVMSSLEDGLAVIGVTPHNVPTSLELPITVTDPRIAPKTSDPLSGTNYGAPLLHSPNIDMYVDAEQTIHSGPINMPLLNDEDECIGKSMPILTDDISEKTPTSTIGSPSSLEVREVDMDDGTHWPQRLLTPGSDSSETSAEIPYQPALQLSVNDLNRN